VRHDVVVFGLVREQWESSPLAEVPVQVSGTVPGAFRVGSEGAGERQLRGVGE
jgi:hypothetical protein